MNKLQQLRMSENFFWTTTVSLVLFVALAQLCRCNVITPGDNPLLSREDIAKLSAIRVRARSESVKTRCSLYASTLEELMGASQPEGADLFGEVIEVLKQRKLPFGNPQPVLEDLQECASQAPEIVEQAGPLREVIAGPPRDEITAPDERMQKIKEERDEVKQRTKDRGQDIYYKPDSQSGDNFDHSPGNDGTHDTDDESDSDSDYRVDESDEDDDDDDEAVSVEDTEAADKEKLEMDLEQKNLEIENLKKQIDSLAEKIDNKRDLKLTAGPDGETDSARYESIKQLYEDSLEREKHLRRILAENDSDKDDDDDKKDKKNKKKDRKDDKKKIKDPAEQAAILFDKMSAKDQPEDRCYKYYLLFSYPDKVIKKTIKTIAKLQINLRDMDEFLSLVNPAFAYKLEQILDDLSASKKKDAQRAAEEFRRCLTAGPTADNTDANSNPNEIKVEYVQPDGGRRDENPNKFDIPVELYPKRKTVDSTFHEDTYEQVYPPAPGQIGGPRGSVAGAWAAAAAGGYGNLNGRHGFGGMQPIDPMPDRDDYYFGRNPYMR